MNVTIYPAGSWAFPPEEIEFTSPDLNASCESAPAASTTVVDLGIWSQGLLTPSPRSDYDCSGGLNGIVDLGVWAGGLTAGC
jgi:hypothetical protein